MQKSVFYIQLRHLGFIQFIVTLILRERKRPFPYWCLVIDRCIDRFVRTHLIQLQPDIFCRSVCCYRSTIVICTKRSSIRWRSNQCIASGGKFDVSRCNTRTDCHIGDRRLQSTNRNGRTNNSVRSGHLINRYP